MHPSHDAIASYADGSASATDRVLVETHLATGCALCGGRLQRARDVLHALSEDSLEPEIPGAAERALAAIARRMALGGLVTPLEGVLERVATRIFDSLRPQLIQGSRGAEAAVRQIVFTSQEDRFTVQVSSPGERRGYRIVGQLLMADGTVEGLGVLLQETGGMVLSTQTEPTGEFRFDNVPPGSYSLIVRRGPGITVLPGIELL